MTDSGCVRQWAEQPVPSVRPMLTSNHHARRHRYRWKFRLLAMLLSLTPFALIELGLRAAGIAAPDASHDPFVGFSQVVPLFEPNPETDRYEIAAGRLKFFAPGSFAIQKSPGTFRVFCLGGSTVQGRPYSRETSFTSWLRLALEQADSKTNWEVVNCGGISYASYRLVPLLEEVLEYQPDLIIICTGHNEFLEDRTYGHLREVPQWMAAPTQLALQLRIVNLAQHWIHEDRPVAQLPTEVDAILDYQNGLDAFFRQPGWDEQVVTHFQFNIRRMIRLARTHQVPLLILQPVSNLSGTPPFKSAPGVSNLKTIEWLQTQRQAARSRYRSDVAEAIEIWQQVCEADPQHALSWFELGRCCEAVHRHAEALNAYVRARDEDIVPLRMISMLEQSLQDVVKEERVPFLNLQQHFAANSAGGIVGDNWLVDHVHPSFEGHQQIALLIGRWMKEEGMVDLPASWETHSQAKFNAYFESLDRTYFHRGQRMLEALELWTQGKSDGPPVESRFPERIGKNLD